MQGYQTGIISTESISWQISQLAKTDDAQGMALSHNGKIFYILTFPTANKTFAFNHTDSPKAGRKLWFELQSYPVQNDNKWRGNCVAEYGKTTFVGDFENGNIYKLDSGYYKDNNKPLKWICTTQGVHDPQAGANIFYDELTLFSEVGRAIDGLDPVIALRYSDDNGYTWSNEIWTTLGKIGEYYTVPKWEGLGMSEGPGRIFEFSGTDSVPRTFRPPRLEAELGLI